METRNINSFTELFKSFPLMALVEQLVKISKLVEIDKANFFTWRDTLMGYLYYKNTHFLVFG